MRLAKYIAHAGVASRRAAEELIAQGRVSLEGQVVRDPAVNVEAGARVSVDGRMLDGPQALAVYVLHKPVGVLSTAHDPYGRPTVVELLDERDLRLYPVGRLDADSSGLILLTNDGELANRLTHPRFEVPKTYRVRVGGGPVPDRALRQLRSGVRLEDGLTAPARVRRVEQDPRRGDLLELTITEGRNRQVRRMCEAVGHPVRGLQRVAFGALTLGDLAPGKYRRLGMSELAGLRGGARTGARSAQAGLRQSRT